MARGDLLTTPDSDAIRDARRRSGRTVAELAVLAGVSVSTLQKAERGALISIRSLQRIQRALDGTDSDIGRAVEDLAERLAAVEGRLAALESPGLRVAADTGNDAVTAKGPARTSRRRVSTFDPDQDG